MLTYFSVENYKNFRKKIELNLCDIGGYKFSSDCIYNNCISKLLIYGRNAVGKSNLGQALIDIYYLFTGLPIRGLGSDEIINADSDCQTADFHYKFKFGETAVDYCYSKSSLTGLSNETFKINNQLVFNVNFEEDHFKLKVDANQLKLLGAKTIRAQNYIDSLTNSDDERNQIPFLRWLINNTATTDNSLLNELNDYVLRMLYIAPIASRLRSRLDLFTLRIDKSGKLNDFEIFLNNMGIECKLQMEELPGDRKELYFSHKKPLPFNSTASSGTFPLKDIYSCFILRPRKPSLVILDEFDAFFHYEMAENVITFLKQYPACQVIMTTHNTNLMTNRIMRPDTLFILSRDGRLTSLKDATERELREGHNLEKMYTAGEFEAYE